MIAASSSIALLCIAGGGANAPLEAAAPGDPSLRVVDQFTLDDARKAETVEINEFQCFQPNAQFGEIDERDRRFVNGDWGNHEFVYVEPAGYGGGPVDLFLYLTGGGFAWIDTSFAADQLPAELRGRAWGEAKGEGRHAGPEARLLSTQWWNRKHAYSVFTYSPLEELPVQQGKPTTFINRFRARFPDWAILYPSYCSRDAYYGKGELGPDGRRYGYAALVQALKYVDGKHGIGKLFVGGTSAGGLGSAVIARDLRRDLPNLELLGAIVDSGPAEGRGYAAVKDQDVVDGLRRIVIDEQGTRAWVVCDDPLQDVERGMKAIGFLDFSLNRAIQEGKITVPIFHAWQTRDIVTLCADLDFSQRFMDGAIARAITEYDPGAASVNYEKCQGAVPACTLDQPVPPEKCPADRIVQVQCAAHGVIGRGDHAEDVFRWMQSLIEKAGKAQGGDGHEG